MWATQNFHDTLRLLRDELKKVFGVSLLAQELAENYNKLLKALEEKKPTQSFLYKVHIKALGCVHHSEEGQQALSVFRKELEKAAERVTAITGASKKIPCFNPTISR